MATQVNGDLYVELDGKMVEIKRQMRQPGGYPFDPEKLNKFLQRAVEGRFDDNQRWRREDGIIFFDVAFDGTSGPDWIPRLERGGKRISDYARSTLFSSEFKSAKAGTARIAVLPGEFFTDDNRITEKIRAEGKSRKWGKPNHDLACVVREMFSDADLEAMGLWAIVAMSDLIKVSDGDPYLLGAHRYDNGSWLNAYYDKPDSKWNPDSGFAFVSQVSSDQSLGL